MVPRREPGYVADLAEDQTGGDGPDAVDPSECGARVCDRSVDLQGDLVDATVESCDVIDVIAGELDPHHPRRIGEFQAVDQGGAVTDLLWHFDYYVDGKLSRNGKHYSETVRENFRLGGHDLSWNPQTSTVSASFNLKHFLNDEEIGQYIGYKRSSRHGTWPSP